nr:ribonuclease H-like domain-containing protein [Tanacetum cinerariifolium]
EYIGSDEVCDLSTPSVYDPEPDNREVKSLYESDKSSASETYDFASCVSSPKTNDSFSIVDVKLLPKSDVKDLSLTNDLPSCSFKENVKPPRNLCNKSGTADRIPCKNTFDSSASISAGRSIPAASRNGSASIHAGKPIPAGRFNKPAPFSAGSSVPTCWTNPAARPFFRPTKLVVLGEITDLICNGVPRTMVDLINLHGFALNDPQGRLNDKSSASETYDFASCVSSPKTNDSFSTVDVKILPNKSHLIKDCHVYDTVDNFRSVILKVASVPAGSRNSSESTSVGRSIPAASRNRPASIHAGRYIPAGRFNKPAPFLAGRSVPTGWTNHDARPFFRPTNLYFDNISWPGIYEHMSMNEGRWGSAVKSLAGIVDSGCSRSMTGNKEKLDDFVQIKGGTITFEGGDGKITGKGTIRTSRLNFENVYYVEELQNFNLFSISQICDKKNTVLFTDDECLVLTKEFQLPDESQTINKLAKNGLVEGLPLKLFTNEHNCVACNKGKQHKASYKAISVVRTISEPLQLLHIDLFGPTSIRSIDHKYYSLVVTNDFSRVSITNPHNKTPYELLSGKVPNIRHLKPFGCQVTILNTSDHLGKFARKANDGFLVGYAANSKAYRVYNLSSKKVEETLNLRYLEDKPNVQGLGQKWYFDLDYLIDSLGYTRFKTNTPAGPKVNDVFAPMENNLDYAEELARLQRQEYEAHSAAVKYGFEFSNETAEMLHQAKIKTRRNLVLLLEILLVVLFLLVEFLLVVFLLRRKEEKGYILKDFIALIENQLNKKVKAIRVSITNPYNKTPYELLSGKVPNIRHLKPLGCQVTILNTSDHLGKFEGKANASFLVGYAANSKAYRVYNLSSKKVEETLNLRYLEDKPNVQGLGQEWYFDLYYFTDSLGYTHFKTNTPAGTQDTNINAGTQDDDLESECDEQAILVPSFPSNSFSGPNDVSAPMKNNLDYAKKIARLQRQEHEAHSTAAKNLVLAAGDPAGSIVSTGGVPAGSVPASHVPASSVPAGSVPASSVPSRNVPTGGVLSGSIDSAGFGDPAASESVPAIFTPDHATNSTLPPGHSLGSSEHSTRFPSSSDLGNHQPTAGIFSSSSYDDDFCADVTNLASSVAVDPVATKRVNTIHPQS